MLEPSRVPRTRPEPPGASASNLRGRRRDSDGSASLNDEAASAPVQLSKIDVGSIVEVPDQVQTSGVRARAATTAVAARVRTRKGTSIRPHTRQSGRVPSQAVIEVPAPDATIAARPSTLARDTLTCETRRVGVRPGTRTVARLPRDRSIAWSRDVGASSVRGPHQEVRAVRVRPTRVACQHRRARTRQRLASIRPRLHTDCPVRNTRRSPAVGAPPEQSVGIRPPTSALRRGPVDHSAASHVYDRPLARSYSTGVTSTGSTQTCCRAKAAV